MPRKTKYDKDNIIRESLSLFSQKENRDYPGNDFIFEVCENLKIPYNDQQKIKYILKISSLFDFDSFGNICINEKGKYEQKSEKTYKPKDTRDQNNWIVLELTNLGEQKILENKLEEIIKSLLGFKEIEIFIPTITYTRGNKNVALHLMEGYIFISSCLDEDYYFQLEQTPYINKVMTTDNHKKMRQLSVVEDHIVQTMKMDLRKLITSTIVVGDSIIIVRGNYKNLEGKVFDVYGDYAEVEIILRSVAFITKVPKVFLEQYENYT